MPLPISDLSSFSPQNPFLKDIIDVSADAATQQVIGEKFPDDQKETQRVQYIKIISELRCLKGHGIVNLVMGELEIAKTNRDFLDAMKRVTPLIHRVRKKLAEVQILEFSPDPFSPLEFKKALTGKKVGVLEKLSASDNVIMSNAAVFFLNRILPLLGQKIVELERWAHAVGEPVFRDDREFPGDFYGWRQAAKSSETSVERRIWNGVQLPNRSEYGPKLLKLSKEAQYVDRIITFEELAKLLSDSETPIKIWALKQGLIKLDNLFKTAGKPTPYEKKHRQGILFHSSSLSQQSVVPAAPEEWGFIPNADFLDKPLMFQAEKPAWPVPESLTSDIADKLGLGEDAAKILKHMMKKPDAALPITDILKESQSSPRAAVKMDDIIGQINSAIAPHTTRRLVRRGTMMTFAITK